MNWHRIWENVIIGSLCILIPSLIILLIAGLYFGESLVKKIGIEETIGDYQEEVKGKYDKAIDLHNQQQEQIERLRVQVNNPVKKWHK